MTLEVLMHHREYILIFFAFLLFLYFFKVFFDMFFYLMVVAISGNHCNYLYFGLTLSHNQSHLQGSE